MAGLSGGNSWVLLSKHLRSRGPFWRRRQREGEGERQRKREGGREEIRKGDAGDVKGRRKEKREIYDEGVR